MYHNDSSQNHQVAGGAGAEAAPPALGEWEPAYRALFWRAFLGTRVYGVYDALAAAAGCDLVAGRVAALAGFGDERALPEALARLEAEGLVRRLAAGMAVLSVLPPLTPVQAATLPRSLRNSHLDFLGLVPGFDLPAWWRRDEPSFAPAAARQWGWKG